MNNTSNKIKELYSKNRQGFFAGGGADMGSTDPDKVANRAAAGFGNISGGLAASAPGVGGNGSGVGGNGSGGAKKAEKLSTTSLTDLNSSNISSGLINIKNKIKDYLLDNNYNSYSKKLKQQNLTVPTKDVWSQSQPKGVINSLTDAYNNAGANWKTAGDISKGVGNIATFGMPSMLGLGASVIDGTPALTANQNSYDLSNITGDIKDIYKTDDNGIMGSTSSKVKDYFRDKFNFGTLKLDKFDDLEAYNKAIEEQKYKGKYVDFNKAIAAGATFKNPKIAVNLTNSQFEAALSNNSFTDPDLAQAYRSADQLRKAEEKEATRGKDRSRNDVKTEQKDLSVLSENGLKMYNQLLTSGYDDDYAFNSATMYE